MRFKIPMVLLILLLAVLLPPASASAAEISEELRGHWTAEDGQAALLVEPERIVVQTAEGGLEIYGLLSTGAGDLDLLHRGKPVTWHVERNAETLLIRRPGELQRFQIAEGEPSPAMQLKLFPIAPDEDLDTASVLEISRGLAQRNARDQEARQRDASSEEIAAIAAENAEYLKKLIQDVGWIDVDRFGVEAAFDAVLIVKHSRDLRFMLSVLPHIEHDFKAAGPNAQAFAILYDAIQIRSGRPQKYGTQIGWIHGKPHVLPLEDARRVDEWRSAIGLSPLNEYLEIAGSQLGEEIQIDPNTSPQVK